MLVLLDLGLPGGSGFDVFAAIEGRERKPTIVVVTARDDMQSTVKAIQLGAYEYLVKPIDIDRLHGVVQAALASRESRSELVALAARSALAGEILGKSPAIRDVWKQIGAVSTTRAPVLITGESGTGKELVAKAIHNAGAAPSPAQAVRRGQLPGARTWRARERAVRPRQGRVHRRGRRSARSVRARRQGDAVPRRDRGDPAARFKPSCCACCRSARSSASATPGRCRSTRASSPQRTAISPRWSRRARSARICTTGCASSRFTCRRCASAPATSPCSSRACSAKIARELGKEIHYVTPTALARLAARDWPGNIRELENTLTRAVVLAKTDVLDETLLPLEAPRPTRPDDHPDGTLPTLREIERRHIVRVLAETEWNKRRACAILDISRPTLDRKIEEYGLRRGRADVNVGVVVLAIAAIGAAYAGLVLRAAPKRRDNLLFGALALSDAVMTAWRGVNVLAGWPIITPAVAVAVRVHRDRDGGDLDRVHDELPAPPCSSAGVDRRDRRLGHRRGGRARRGRPHQRWCGRPQRARPRQCPDRRSRRSTPALETQETRQLDESRPSRSR